LKLREDNDSTTSNALLHQNTPETLPLSAGGSANQKLRQRSRELPNSNDSFGDNSIEAAAGFTFSIKS